MKKQKKVHLKALPKFKTEDDEREFWATHSVTDYFDMSKGQWVNFPNLKPSTETISIRLPLHLLDHIKMAANKRDVPYQSLIKIMLADTVMTLRDEYPKPKKKSKKKKTR